MRLISIAAAVSAFLLTGTAVAQDKDKATAQQERMKSCNAQANKRELKGDKRREFMSGCLSA